VVTYFTVFRLPVSFFVDVAVSKAAVIREAIFYLEEKGVGGWEILPRKSFRHVSHDGVGN
jgi:hypothetical protein